MYLIRRVAVRYLTTLVTEVRIVRVSSVSKVPSQNSISVRDIVCGRVIHHGVVGLVAESTLILLS